MQSIFIFRDAFSEFLRKSTPANLAKYQRDAAWAQEVGPKSSREMETALKLKEPLALELPADGKMMDVENAVRVHNALRQLTPLQAADRRLWTRLAHVELWEYMRHRWPVERHAADEGKAARFVESRYFVAQRQSRALLRNGIARLWWTAHLSFDAERENPYELTAVLLSSLDITQQLLERNFGRAPAIVHGFLDFLLQHKELLASGDANRVCIRRLAKYINMAGGVCILDCLTASEVMVHLETEFARLRPEAIPSA